MSVLDELRKHLQMMASLSASRGYMPKHAVFDAIDAFEAAHPGLVDDTEPCSVCGKPTSWRNEAGVRTSDKGILCWDCYDGPLRPACAKEANDDH